MARLFRQPGFSSPATVASLDPRADAPCQPPAPPVPAAYKMAGRKPHAPTDKDRQYVRSLCAYGLKEEAIAMIVGISPHTLRKHYRAELDTALQLLNAKVASSLHEFIDRKVGGPKEWLTATIFRLKCHGGWRETDRRELTHANPDGSKMDAATVVVKIAERFTKL